MKTTTRGKTTIPLSLQSGGRLGLGVAFAFVLLGTAVARGGVFDDALLWMRGPVDMNVDGWIKTTDGNADTQDLPDALKAGVSASATHTWVGLGPYTNIHVVANGEVSVPYANIKANSSYLHFDQPSWVVGDVTNVLGGCIRTAALPAMTNADPHTVFMRLRVDSFLSDSECANLFALGYSSGSGKGAGWKLMLVPDGEGFFRFKVVNGRPNNTQLETGTGTKELTAAYDSELTRLATNQWFDLVFACGSNGAGGYSVDLYTCGAGGAFSSDSSGIGWYSTSQSGSGTYLSTYVFGNGGAGYVAPTDVASSVIPLRQFRGDIAQIAFWNRRLTESEAREAMAWPRNDRWRLGVKDGTSDQFAGTAGATVNASSVNAFAQVPPSLSKGESFSVSFGMDVTNTLGRAQVLRVCTTAASAARATFAVSVNGGETQSFFVQADGEGTVGFPAKMVVDGVNTLMLKCVSLSGGEAAVFDSLALGGAWTVGFADNSHAEFASITTSGISDKQSKLHAEDTDWKRTVINLSATSKWATNTIHALADAAVSNVRNGRFVLRGKTHDNPSCPMRVELLVNGVSAGSYTFPLGGGYENAVFPIAAGSLNDGDNVFTLINRAVDDGAQSPTGYISMDCRYFEFLPDRTGFVLSYR